MKAKVHVELDDLVRLQFDQHRFSFLPKQPIHSLLSGRHASRLRGRGLQFEELRHYRPGDDIRSMDWRATARLKKPHVRVFSEERERTVLFVIDQRNGMHFGSARATKAVAACELAALGVWRTLSMGDRAAAIIFNDEETAYVPPHRSRATVHRICSEMVTMNQKLDAGNRADNPNALDEALRQAANLAKHDFLIVLATDCHGAGPETRKLVSRLAAHNDMMAALVYDPLGIRLPTLGSLEVTDGEKQLTIPEGRSFQDNYEAAFVEWGRLIQERFSALKVPVLPICTHDDVGDQILSALGYNV
ncbi:DUF58 domain-containing protein [Pontiellaceae bacterium B12227]|nr:DUF58 domain-containing protein [Pontiellaceae bacterium B12227]